MGATAYFGLGSNLGDRLANLASAVEVLAAQAGIRVARSSRVYETDPLGGPTQPEVLNAVVEVETDLAPRELLEPAGVSRRSSVASATGVGDRGRRRTCSRTARRRSTSRTS
jgi:hypothetical protein